MERERETASHYLGLSHLSCSTAGCKLEKGVLPSPGPLGSPVVILTGAGPWGDHRNRQVPVKKSEAKESVQGRVAFWGYSFKPSSNTAEKPPHPENTQAGLYSPAQRQQSLLNLAKILLIAISGNNYMNFTKSRESLGV